MLNHSLATLIALFIPIISFSQVEIPRAKNDALDSLQVHFNQKWKADSAKAVEMGFPIIQQGERTTLSFVGFENNRPIYNSFTTQAEVETYNGQQLWATPYEASGTGYAAAIWEAFAGSAALPNANNGNLQTNGASPSRVTLKNSGTTSSHATNVALRIAGDGNASTTAVGPAKTANIDAWDISDVYTEMAANIGSYLVSNHSYAEVHGWTPAISYTLNGNTQSVNWWSESNVSKTEAYGFGRYGSADFNLDLLANAAPYHCIVKAAGNDRNDNGNTPVTTFNTADGAATYTFDTYSSPVPEQDGGIDGFDCLPSGAVAKNSFVIGSCNNISGGYSAPSDVSTPSFSNYGPTDDGRIKPDFVAPGQGGTSYASPNVAGSILILQEIYANQFGAFMKSATVKALMAHTAFEAGTAEGPDYKHGWGLINPVGAADFIVDANNATNIKELTLANGEEKYFLVYADGTNPITTTLSWTDPEATPAARTYGPSDLDNPASMLINDLDLRLIDLSTNTVQTQPYVLDPANPANAATKGDNFRDNIEKIYWATPAAGWYAIRVNHKSTLAAPQDFSLIISGASGPDCANANLPTIDNEWNGSSWLNTFAQGQNVIVKGNLTINTNTTFGALVMSPNAKITVSSGAVLEITGNVSAFESTVIDGSGELLLSGSSTQNWCGGGTVNNLAIENSNGVVLGSQSVSVNDSVVLRNGTLAANGFLTLLSTPGKYAQIHENGGAISGEIEFQQTINSNGWHHIASPVNTTIGDLLEEMTQFNLAPNGGNIYRWDAAAGAWTHPLDTTIVFDANSAFNTFFGTTGAHTFSPIPFTIKLRGEPNSGAVINTVVYGSSTAISVGAGWNMIANPYPENLDWSTIKANFGGANINNFYYVWDAATSTYKFHDANSGDASLDGFIAPGQAFFVKLNDAAAEATTAFNFTNANRSLGAANFFKTEFPQIKLMVEQGEFSDAFDLVFEEGNTVDLQPKKDAFKLFSPENAVPQIYQFVDTANSLALNFVEQEFENLSVPISFLNHKSGDVKLSAALENINPNWSIILEDKWLKNHHDLRNSPYVFQHEGDNTPGRFVLHINLKSELKNFLIVWGKEGSLILNLSQPQQQGKVTIYNSIGQVVYNSNHQHFDALEIPFSMHGIFTVQVELNSGELLVEKFVN